MGSPVWKWSIGERRSGRPIRNRLAIGLRTDVVLNLSPGRDAVRVADTGAVCRIASVLVAAWGAAGRAFGRGSGCGKTTNGRPRAPSKFRSVARGRERDCGS